MRKFDKWNCLTYLGAAQALGVSLWRVRYAVESGYLPPPSVVLKRRPLFSPEQLEGMRQFFAKEEAHRRKRAGQSVEKSGESHPA